MRCSVEFAEGELALVVLAVCRRGLMFWVGNAAVGDSVANWGYETEQAINMGENSG